MRLGQKKIIDELEYKIQVGKELLKYFPEDEKDQTKESKDAMAFVKHEITMCETMIVLITTGS